MIISRTPYRISFFGGGTDYLPWYQEHGGAVLATSINRYCYLTCRYLPPFFEHTSQIMWSKVELVKDHAEIQHPVVRETLKYLNIQEGIDIRHQGDLPARSGIGSSSAFTVGLLNALYALKGNISSKYNLAKEAVHIEREILREHVGIQDQITTAYGGFNRVEILPNGEFQVSPVILPARRLEELQNSLLLFYTGIARNASDIAGEKIKAIPKKQSELSQMRALVDQAQEILTSSQNLNAFGQLLHEGWQLKRGLSQTIAPECIDALYKKALNAGALGGKLLGAGGGGFMLFFAPPETHESIRKELASLLAIPIKFEQSGSQIIFYDSSQQYEPPAPKELSTSPTISSTYAHNLARIT